MPVTADEPVLRPYRGDTFVKIFQFSTKDPTTGVLTPIDLRAYGDSWEGQLRRSEDNPDAISFDVDSSQAAAGQITVTLTPDRTAQLPSKGVWDLQVTDITQTPPYVRTMLKGTFERDKDVSR